MDFSTLPPGGALQLLGMSLTLIGASIVDLRERRVPNRLTYGSIGIALCYQTALGSLSLGVAGLLACGALGILVYSLSRLGAGDAKLLMAIGAWLGPGLGLDVALLTCVGGAVIGATMLLSRGWILHVARELWLSVLTLSTPGAKLWVPDGSLSFPLAPVMAASFLVVVATPAIRPVSPLLEQLC